MGYPSKKSNTTCQFWSIDSKKCRVCNDGLFIPLEEHITAYCTTEDHYFCLQYSLHAPKHSDAGQDRSNKGRNRRQSLRIELSNQIDLLKMIKSGEIVEQLSEKAETLDISKIGMRLHTDIPLTSDTVIQFAFNKKFPKALRTGAGLVEWCNKQIDAPGYQAGISFQSTRLVEAMNTFLEPHLSRI
ncbi:PilZ domain-containing protein [Desulforhopalus sp. 52FAK]